MHCWKGVRTETPKRNVPAISKLSGYQPILACTAIYFVHKQAHTLQCYSNRPLSSVFGKCTNHLNQNNPQVCGTGKSRTRWLICEGLCTLRSRFASKVYTHVNWRVSRFFSCSCQVPHLQQSDIASGRNLLGPNAAKRVVSVWQKKLRPGVKKKFLYNIPVVLKVGGLHLVVLGTLYIREQYVGHEGIWSEAWCFRI